MQEIWPLISLQKYKKKTIFANKYKLNIIIFNFYVDVIVIYLFSKWMFLLKTN